MESDPKTRRRLEQLMAGRRQEVLRVADTRARANPAARQLRVTLPEPPPVTAAMVAARYAERLWEKAERTPFQPDEAVDWDDEVQVQFELLVRGRTMNEPRSVKLRVEPLPLLPGLAEVLLGAQVGLIREDVSIQLPPQYPDPALRNCVVGVVIRLEDAWKVHVPAPDSPEALERLGLGATREDAEQALYLELAHERVAAAWDELRDRLLDALVAQTPLYLNPAAVDEELRRRFEDSPESVTEDPELRGAVLAGWLGDPDKRAAAERRLRIRLALEEVARRDGVTVPEDLREEMLRDYAASRGISEDEAREALAADPDAAQRFEALAWEAAVMDHLIAQAEILIGS